MSKSISKKEVTEHNTVDNGLWIIIDNNVYEMKGFVDEHPGGSKILKRVGGMVFLYQAAGAVTDPSRRQGRLKAVLEGTRHPSFLAQDAAHGVFHLQNFLLTHATVSQRASP